MFRIIGLEIDKNKTVFTRSNSNQTHTFLAQNLPKTTLHNSSSLKDTVSSMHFLEIRSSNEKAYIHYVYNSIFYLGIII